MSLNLTVLQGLNDSIQDGSASLPDVLSSDALKALPLQDRIEVIKSLAKYHSALGEDSRVKPVSTGTTIKGLVTDAIFPSLMTLAAVGATLHGIKSGVNALDKANVLPEVFKSTAVKGLMKRQLPIVLAASGLSALGHMAVAGDARIRDDRFRNRLHSKFLAINEDPSTADYKAISVMSSPTGMIRNYSKSLAPFGPIKAVVDTYRSNVAQQAERNRNIQSDLRSIFLNK